MDQNMNQVGGDQATQAPSVELTEEEKAKLAQEATEAPASESASSEAPQE